MREEFKFFHQIRVRYSEIDGQGIVFNAHYLTYADVAVTEYMRNMGLDYMSLAAKGEMDMALVKTSLEFKAPAHFDDLLDVGVRVSRIGDRSFDVDFQIFRAGNSDLLVSVHTVYVNYNVARRSAEPVPAFFIRAVEGVEGALSR